MNEKIEQLAKELKLYYDYIEKYDAIMFLRRNNTKYNYVSIPDASKAWELAYN